MKFRVTWAVMAVFSTLLAEGGALAVPEPPPLAFAMPERTLLAPEARQGVASGDGAVYAVDNSTIVAYRIADGRELVRFEGDPRVFAHINSCTLAAGELVCAASNYPAVPHRGTVEFFDPLTLAHLRTVALPENPGSLTALQRHEGKWWASFAHYDGKGGVVGRDHRETVIARMSDGFAIERSWKLPADVLDRLAPRSVSGLAWGCDGRLYASGHDKPEIYVLEVPEQGGTLRHRNTFATSTFGQAIDFDRNDQGLLWSIDRATGRIVGSRVPGLSRCAAFPATEAPR